MGVSSRGCSDLPEAIPRTQRSVMVRSAPHGVSSTMAINARSLCVWQGYLLATLLILFVPSCNVTSQIRLPGCLDRTVVRTDRDNGSVRGSVVTLGDGRSYKNLGIEDETSTSGGVTTPWSIPRGTSVIVCPGSSPSIYEISLDQIGTQYHQFRILKQPAAKRHTRAHPGEEKLK